MHLKVYIFGYSMILWYNRICILYSILSSGREMTLSNFKAIYYMEWAHRLWGRATGMVFLLPAGFFLYKGWISQAMKPRLGIYAALIGAQVILVKYCRDTIGYVCLVAQD